MSDQKFELCPNFRKHCDEGHRWQEGIALYKKEQRDANFRRGYESSAARCNWCNPPCPTCGTRFCRSPKWLAKIAKAVKRG